MYRYKTRETKRKCQQNVSYRKCQLKREMQDLKTEQVEGSGTLSFVCTHTHLPARCLGPLHTPASVIDNQRFLIRINASAGNVGQHSSLVS